MRIDRAVTEAVQKGFEQNGGVGDAGGYTLRQGKLFEESWAIEYHENNPQIYEMFKRFALEKIRNGASHLGSKMIMERIRWESPVMANGDPFKVNNRMTPFYARLFMKEFPEHEGIFATRKAKADVEVV